MAAWTTAELDAIAAAEELDLRSLRNDGTLRRPVTMWVVRAGDDIYVRSVNGRGSAWFRGAQARHEARVRASGIEKDVSLIETADASAAIDAAYDAKYGRRYPSIVPSIIAPGARAATLRLVSEGRMTEGHPPRRFLNPPFARPLGSRARHQDFQPKGLEFDD
jgi:hypothetical protein